MSSSDSPRRIAFIDQSGGRSSGAQESLALLLRALPSSLDKIVVLFQHGAYEERLRAAGYEVIVHPVSRALERASRYGPQIASAIISSSDVFGVASVLRRIKPDIVHTNTVKAHLMGIPAARLVGVPSIMHLRDALSGLGRVTLRSLGRHVATRSIAVSQHVADWYAIPKVDVVYNALDLAGYELIESKQVAREALGLPTDVPLIGMVGPIHSGKGHERFLRILRGISQNTDALGLIVGDARFGNDDSVLRVRSIARELGVAERVRFVPWQDDPRRAFAALDVICNCSTFEPFGRSIAEAAASRVPSVIFSDCGVAEIFVDGLSASIVTAYDEDQFGLRLLGLINQPERLAAMGAEAKTAVMRLGLDRHSQEIMKIYSKVDFVSNGQKVRSTSP